MIWENYAFSSVSFTSHFSGGKARMLLHRFGCRPLTSSKSYFFILSCHFFKVDAERKVTFDHGREGSIAEDCFFSMVAFRDGYTFDFIEGITS